MTIARRHRESPDPRAVDQRVFLHDVSWAEYEGFLRMRGEKSVPRATYLEGEMELMVPSWYHEDDKKKLARLVEAWSEEAGIGLVGGGSWTLKKENEERGAEPDECYVVMRTKRALPPPAPDFAIEVVWTHGGIDKLDVYRKLGVLEVWYWKDRRLSFHALRGDQYEEVTRSEVLPEFDPGLVAPFMELPQHEAIPALRLAMRSS
jgi:Uma2 family endonuclease